MNPSYLTLIPHPSTLLFKLLLPQSFLNIESPTRDPIEHFLTDLVFSSSRADTREQGSRTCSAMPPHQSSILWALQVQKAFSPITRNLDNTPSIPVVRKNAPACETHTFLFTRLWHVSFLQYVCKGVTNFSFVTYRHPEVVGRSSQDFFLSRLRDEFGGR